MSAEVDAIAGIVVGAIAVDAYRHTTEPSQVALAAVPVVLAAHQLIEMVVWWGIDGTVASSVGTAATYAYLLIAFGLPLVFPPAVAAMEPDEGRRRLMKGLGIVGSIVALVLLAGVVSAPVGAVDGGYHVTYHARLFHGTALTVIYVLATLGCCLASSHRVIVAFGALNIAGVAFLGWLTLTGFVSLWCAWAAVTSLLIAVHLRRLNAPQLTAGLPEGDERTRRRSGRGAAAGSHPTA